MALCCSNWFASQCKQVPIMAAEDITSLLEYMNRTSLLEYTNSTKLGGDSDDNLPQDGKISQDVKTQRTQGLRTVLARAQELRQPESLDDLLAITQKLATGSRDASWRLPIGDSGILDFCLDLLAEPETNQSLKIQALRLVGNSCADTDENRARVVDGAYFLPIIKLLIEDELVPFVIPSLHNICIEYEPAYSKAAEAGLSKALAEWLQSQRVAKAPHLVGIAAKTIGLLASTEHEKASKDTFIPITLLKCASSPPSWPAANASLDIEDFVSLVSTATAYLTPDRIVMASTSSSDSLAIYKGLETACTRFSFADADEDDLDDANHLINMRKALVGIVADLSSQPNWTESFSTSSDGNPTKWLADHGITTDWLSRHHSPLQEAACLTFGNLACDDAKTSWLVQTLGIHKPLISLLANEYPYTPGPDDAAPGAVLHSAIGLLKNLAIPLGNRPVLGEHLLSTVSRVTGDTEETSATGVLPFLWAHKDTQPQTQLATISLCRLLLTGTPSNARLFCEPLPANTTSDENTPQQPRTQLHALIQVFTTAPTEPTKTEASRAALALCRVLHGSGGPESTILTSPAWQDPTTGPLANFLARHDGIHNLLAFLLTQTRFPALRSEAWFVLALMTRHGSDGASLVARTLTSSDEALAALERAVSLGQGQAAEEAARKTEEDKKKQVATVDGIEGLGLEPKQADPRRAAQMAKIDRENVLVLLVQLLKTQAALEVLSEEHKTKLQQLMQTGGEMVLGEREQPTANA
ncbi:uncharacterized protein PgNI_11971 [Pyricularia grisea]|uniref:Uncharacterized protein n=1 Tax=Pyricularia grisea TaxID=148305 RepID=A0A6P8AQM2_PYRGI|nr:uncharacterized protein PgNI_11971 [Pyricularia grisea]TLD04338.1 hypothetical protein PgNI_11971 [Pyricularia grisea]